MLILHSPRVFNVVLSSRFTLIAKLRPRSLKLGGTCIFLHMILFVDLPIWGVVGVMRRDNAAWCSYDCWLLFHFYSVTSIVTFAAIVHQKALIQKFLTFRAICFLEFFRPKSLLLRMNFDLVHVVMNTWQKLSGLVLLRVVRILEFQSVICPFIKLLELVVIFCLLCGCLRVEN